MANGQGMMMPEFMQLRAQKNKAIDELRKATLNPFLERTMGYVDPQTKMQRLMADTDFNSADSIQNTFNSLMKQNPQKAAEWLKSAEPLIKAYDARQKDDDGFTQDQLYKQRRDKFDRIVKQYESKFCRGSMVGKSCEVPRNLRSKYGQVNEKGEVLSGTVKLPSVKEFFSTEAGALGPKLYDEFMGGDYVPEGYDMSVEDFRSLVEGQGEAINMSTDTTQETGVEKTATIEKPASKTTESIIKKEGVIIDMGDDKGIIKRFKLEQAPELLDTVKERLNKGESLKSIIEKVEKYKFAKKYGDEQMKLQNQYGAQQNPPMDYGANVDG